MMSRLTKAYDSGKVTLDAEHFKPLVQEAIDAEISASPMLKTVTRRLYEYEEENIMKSKLRHKSYKITAGLIVGLTILTAVVLAVSAVYIALWFFPVPTMIICIGTTSYAFAKKIIRLCAVGGNGMKRKCKSCFRYIEDWRDAKAKGLKERDRLGYKPRNGVTAKCLSVHKDEPVSASDKGCKYHKYRWSWNLEMWWSSVSYKFGRWVCEHIICPIGGLRKPVPLEWVDSFNRITDEIIKKGEPKCPHCGEMPYSIEQCVFCGQRFIQEDNDNESSITKHKA